MSIDIDQNDFDTPSFDEIREAFWNHCYDPELGESCGDCKYAQYGTSKVHLCMAHFVYDVLAGNADIYDTFVDKQGEEQ